MSTIETKTLKPSNTVRRRARRMDRTSHAPAHTPGGRPHHHRPSPHFARIRLALRDAIDAAFDLADQLSTPTERPCVRRVRRAFDHALAGKARRPAPEFEDLAVTGDVLLRALDVELGPIHPATADVLASEVATLFASPKPGCACPRMTRPAWTPPPFVDRADRGARA